MINDETKIKLLTSFDKEKLKADSGDLQRLLAMLQDDFKTAEENTDEEAELSKQVPDTVEAFVAMGGSADKEGFVHKSVIEEIILSFELTIDIQEFLDQIPEDQINFESFCQLFEQPFDDSKSMLSMKSVDHC